VIVVDASVAVDVLLRGPDAEALTARLLDRAEALHAPDLLDVEVAQVLRRFALRGVLGAARGREALRLLASFPLTRHEHSSLLPRIWALRANLTAYDATYIALAEVLEGTLLTRDKRLAAVRGHYASIEVM
jgi:predicted nucleic acid-binding protein